ncbi:cytochrome b/b6 domain-containing protein [Shewanella sp.]|nr:cytochrome b/b6 domain-containing protein [Shewanella sp.]
MIRLTLANAVRFLIARQHLIIVMSVTYLILTHDWLLIGRRLRPHASMWDLTHVYLGMAVTLLAISFSITSCIKGKWRQYFSWLVADFGQVTTDLRGLIKGQRPVAGGKGLISLIEGLGLLLLLTVGLSGILWLLNQGSSAALMWRSYHIGLAHILMYFIVLHVICAALHLLDFIKN